MVTIHPEITGRPAADSSPLAVTVQRACELSGLGPTSIWAGLAAAAYNAGPGRVSAWLASHRPLPGETRN